MAIKHKVADELIKNKMVEPFEFIDLSYANERLKEVNKGKIHKQRADGMCPCIKTNIDNYGVVVYDKN